MLMHKNTCVDSGKGGNKLYAFVCVVVCVLVRWKWNFVHMQLYFSVIVRPSDSVDCLIHNYIYILIIFSVTIGGCQLLPKWPNTTPNP